MTTLKHGYREPGKRGKKKIVRNKRINGLDNPHVGSELGDLFTDVGGSVNDFYIAAYIIEEYGDEIRDDLKDADEDDLRKHVIDIEERQAEPSESKQKRQLEDMLDEANPAERKKILENASETLENSSVNEEDVHDEMVNRGDES